VYVHHRPEPSGAAQSLALLLKALDPSLERHVLVPGGPAADLFARAGAIVHEAPVAVFTHTWDVRYSGARWGVLAREATRLPAHRRALARLLDTVEPTLVHVNDAVMLPAGRIASQRGIPVVWHLRTSLAGGGRATQIAQRLDAWGTAAIAIDRLVAESYPVRLPLDVIPNPVAWAGEPPPRADEAGRAALGIPSGVVSIGFFGYLRRQKGWPELVLAAERLDAEGLPFHVVVVGGGVRPPAWYETRRGRIAARAGVAEDEETAMRSLVEEHRLGRRFSFVPFSTDVRSVYAALDVVTFPNTGKGLGRPVLEAAAAGIPVVAAGSRHGDGVLAPGTTGILLDEVTPDSLADGLRQLVLSSGERERLGSAAAAHAAEALTPRIHAARVEEVYRRISGDWTP